MVGWSGVGLVGLRRGPTRQRRLGEANEEHVPSLEGSLPVGHGALRRAVFRQAPEQ